MEYILLILGIGLLIKSADILVDGASSLSKKLGVSTLVIGLTVVAFGTSAPELFVNIFASISDNNDIALGNIVGSNIANTLLILGIAAMLMHIKVQHSTTWKEIPFSVLAIFALAVFTNKSLIDNIDGANGITRGNGIILLLFFIIFMIYAFNMAKNDKTSLAGKVEEVIRGQPKIQSRSYPIISMMIGGGLFGLYLGGQWTVDGAVTIAKNIGISQYLISATIIAIGTSLPELVATVVAARKRESDLAVGNIIGSNIFNIFFVLGVSSIISPIITFTSVNTDIIFLLIITVLLFIFLYGGKRHSLEKWHGISLLALYAGYLAYIVLRG